MAKWLDLATRAFGTEPWQPDVAELSRWIAENRRRTADIITYQLEASLTPQLSAGILVPCAGGKFYDSRILASLEGIHGRTVRGEVHVNLQEIAEDAAGIVVQKKGAWCAMPAPHLLGIEDRYYTDREEWAGTICGLYRTLMREMRDLGVAGHVLLCDTPDPAELSALARQKTFFFHPAPDRKQLADILEFQSQIAVGTDQLENVFDLMNEYAVQRVFIIDPDPGSIGHVLSHFDPDQVSIGGYCLRECGEYWKRLKENARYRK